MADDLGDLQVGNHEDSLVSTQDSGKMVNATGVESHNRSDSEDLKGARVSQTSHDVNGAQINTESTSVIESALQDTQPTLVGVEQVAQMNNTAEDVGLALRDENILNAQDNGIIHDETLVVDPADAVQTINEPHSEEVDVVQHVTDRPDVNTEPNTKTDTVLPVELCGSIGETLREVKKEGSEQHAEELSSMNVSSAASPSTETNQTNENTHHTAEASTILKVVDTASKTPIMADITTGEKIHNASDDNPIADETVDPALPAANVSSKAGPKYPHRISGGDVDASIAEPISTVDEPPVCGAALPSAPAVVGNKRLFGTWRSHRDENFAKMLEKLRVNFVLRKLVARVHPQLTIAKVDDQEISFAFKMAWFTTTFTARLDDRKTVWKGPGPKQDCITKWENDILVSYMAPPGTDPAGSQNKHVREVTDNDELKVTMIYEDVKAVRWFRRIS